MRLLVNYLIIMFLEFLELASWWICLPFLACVTLVFLPDYLSQWMINNNITILRALVYFRVLFSFRKFFIKTFEILNNLFNFTIIIKINILQIAHYGKNISSSR